MPESVRRCTLYLKTDRRRAVWGLYITLKLRGIPPVMMDLLYQNKRYIMGGINNTKRYQMGTFYFREQKHICGKDYDSASYMEVDIYPVTLSQHRSNSRAKKSEATCLAQQVYNDKRAKRYHVQLVNTNFKAGDYSFTMIICLCRWTGNRLTGTGRTLQSVCIDGAMQTMLNVRSG